MDYQIIIIGAGVVGCSIARKLSRFDLNIMVVDKQSDAAQGASARNSGVIHSGIQVQSGSLKSQLNIKGAKLFPQLCSDLGVAYRRVGKLIVAQESNELAALDKMYKAGINAGISQVSLLTHKELQNKEKHINGIAALYSASEAIISPYELTIALAENAISNGVTFRLNQEVIKIDRLKKGYKLYTPNNSYTCQYIINSSGIWADKISRLAGICDYRIYPCRGEYWVTDKRLADAISSMVYPAPQKGAGGLGIHLTPTISGNILLGPSALYISGREDYRTTKRTLNRLYNEARQFLPLISRDDLIACYAGIRAKLQPPNTYTTADFIIKEEEKAPNFINLVGIESPGLSAAPAIALYVANIIAKKIKLIPKDKFNPYRKAKKCFQELSLSEKAELIKNDPLSGDIICRCEQVTLREVLQALDNPLGANSISAIKYRTRAAMGRCQGGYCLCRLADIIQKQHKGEITLHGPGSPLFVGTTKVLLR